MCPWETSFRKKKLTREKVALCNAATLMPLNINFIVTWKDNTIELSQLWYLHENHWRMIFFEVFTESVKPSIIQNKKMQNKKIIFNKKDVCIKYHRLWFAKYSCYSVPMWRYLRIILCLCVKDIKIKYLSKARRRIVCPDYSFEKVTNLSKKKRKYLLPERCELL